MKLVAWSIVFASCVGASAAERIAGQEPGLALAIIGVLALVKMTLKDS